MIVSDLRDDLVSLGIPSQYGTRKAETGAEAAQKFKSSGYSLLAEPESSFHFIP